MTFDMHEPITVQGGDYSYEWIIVSVFYKRKSNALRFVVEDNNGRLFIHNETQLRKK